MCEVCQTPNPKDKNCVFVEFPLEGMVRALLEDYELYSQIQRTQSSEQLNTITDAWDGDTMKKLF